MRRAVTLVTALALAGPGAAAEEPGTWVQTYPGRGGGEDFSLSAFADGTAYVSRHWWLGTELLRSTDSGVTWTPLPSPFPESFGTVVMGTPRFGIALSSPDEEQVLSTRDGGLSWLPVPLPTGPQAFRPSNTGISPGGRTILITGTHAPRGEECGFPSKPIDAYVSQDAGASWRRIRLPIPGGVAAVAFADARVGAIVVSRDTLPCHHARTDSTSSVWVTEDGGLRWRRSRECMNVCRAIAWAGSSRLVVGEHLHGDLHVSADRGRTFRPAGLLRTGPQGSGVDCVCLSGIAFAPDGEGWAYAAGDGIWHAPAPDGPWTQEPSPLVPAFAWGAIAVTTGGRAVAAGPYAVLTRVPAP